MRWNIVCTDNFARDSRADRLIMGGVEDRERANRAADALNECRVGDGDDRWHVVWPTSRRLGLGMEDIV